MYTNWNSAQNFSSPTGSVMDFLLSTVQVSNSTEYHSDDKEFACSSNRKTSTYPLGSSSESPTPPYAMHVNDNDNDNVNENENDNTSSMPLPSCPLASLSPASSFVSVSNETKCSTIDSLVNSRGFGVVELRKLINFHVNVWLHNTNGSKKNVQELRNQFYSHQYAERAGFLNLTVLSDSEYNNCARAPNLRDISITGKRKKVVDSNPCQRKRVKTTNSGQPLTDSMTGGYGRKRRGPNLFEIKFYPQGLILLRTISASFSVIK
ncbi:hypothetical protein K435DRAFT_793026 [Dendrothele bispora CBS 962.96]|uniref:Uncharacterized protein n=1 Tax=Dendrothele bispora (strain CBS 962.96) TaxID=1314807 RepID=A0A4S8MHL4_DENBC|nr:hypothetical protein K435DRAFT_793026 [Dendrothele bispora CBS 962.96]